MDFNQKLDTNTSEGRAEALQYVRNILRDAPSVNDTLWNLRRDWGDEVVKGVEETWNSMKKEETNEDVSFMDVVGEATVKNPSSLQTSIRRAVGVIMIPYDLMDELDLGADEHPIGVEARSFMKTLESALSKRRLAYAYTWLLGWAGREIMELNIPEDWYYENRFKTTVEILNYIRRTCREWYNSPDETIAEKLKKKYKMTTKEAEMILLESIKNDASDWIQDYKKEKIKSAIQRLGGDKETWGKITDDLYEAYEQAAEANEKANLWQNIKRVVTSGVKGNKINQGDKVFEVLRNYGNGVDAYYAPEKFKRDTLRKVNEKIIEKTTAMIDKGLENSTPETENEKRCLPTLAASVLGWFSKKITTTVGPEKRVTKLYRREPSKDFSPKVVSPSKPTEKKEKA